MEDDDSLEVPMLDSATAAFGPPLSLFVRHLRHCNSDGRSDPTKGRFAPVPGRLAHRNISNQYTSPLGF
jgi:hypothetical protein